MITLSKKLIEIESIKERPENLEKVLDVVSEELKGFKCKKFSKNGVPSLLYYNTPKFPKRFKIILNGHLDVVSAKPEQYKPYVKGNRLYGRGSQDMKAAAAVLIKVYKEVSKKVNYPLGLQLVTDEEVGGFNGTGYQVKKGVRADFVIAGESTNFDVNNKSKGIIWAKVICKGRTSHGAYLWKGDNAIAKMNNFLNTLYRTFPTPKEEVWKTTVNVSSIQTQNMTFNKVPDECTVMLDIRFVPKDEGKILKKLKSILPRGFKLELDTNESFELTSGNNPYIKSLQKSSEKVTKKKSNLLNQHGGSDIRHFIEAGCKGVSYGPVGKGLHTDNEWVNIKSLEKYQEILKDFLLSL